MARNRRRSGAADPVVEPHSCRCLRSATLAPARNPAGGGVASKSRFSAAVSRGRSSAPNLFVPARRGSGPLAGWPLVGAVGPHASALRGGLRAGEPDRAFARVARRVPRLSRGAAGGFFSGHARYAARSGPRAARPAQRGAVDARSVQRDLFRTCLFGALPWVPAG